MMEGKTGSDKLAILAKMIPLTLIMATFFLYDWEDQLLKDYAALFFTSFGVIFALVTSKVIICTMSKMTFSPLQGEVLLLSLYPLA